MGTTLVNHKRFIRLLGYLKKDGSGQL